MARGHAGATPRRARETEWKLGAPASLSIDDVAAALAPLAIDPATRATLVAQYFDTADLALAQRGATLRRREGGTDEGWHLKVPVAVATAAPPAENTRRDRDEIVLPLDASDSDPPDELVSLVSAWTLGRPLEVVARLTTHRAVHPLRDSEGALIGEIADDVVDVHSADASTWFGSPISTFREWEVEARHDHEHACEEAVAALLAAGATPSTASSKLRHALRLDDRPTPIPISTPAGGVVVSAADVFRSYLSQQAEAFAHQDHRVRLDLDDSVHRMRVAARRLRSALRTYAPVLDTEALTPLRNDLEWAADVLGAERDLEVIQRRLVSVVSALGPVDDTVDNTVDDASAKLVVEFVGRALERERRAAHIHVLVAMNEPRWTRLHASLSALADDPPLTPRAERGAPELLPSFVRRQWKAFAKRADNLTLDAPAAEWHRVRIGAKRTRYAADLAAPALGRDAHRFAKQLETVTELLGEFQDSQLLRTRLGGFLSGDDAGLPLVADVDDARALFTLGRAFAAEERSAQRLQQAFLDQWSDVRAPRHRRWTKI